MSYDLFFAGKKLTAEEFSGYFSQRSNYKVNGSQAFYQNEDTGVYFSFDLNTETEKLDPDAPDYDVSFNLNFFRPRIFGLEAEREVHAFQATFGFAVHDPQNDGMGDGPYSTEGFFAGWNSGNEFGYNACLSHPQTNVSALATYPANASEKIWKWNFSRNGVQSDYGEALFVPKVMFIRKDDKVFSAVVWGDAIPSLLPRVDKVLVPRKDLAPSFLFQKKNDLCFIDFEDIARTFGNFLTNDYALPALLLPHPVATPQMKDFVRRLKPHDGKLATISVDQVLDAELVAKHRPSV